MRVLLYSHDGLGLGHIRRNLAIAAALSARAPGTSVLLATGSGELPDHWLPPGVDTVKLPALRKHGNGEYEARSLGMDGDDMRAIRSSVLDAAVRSMRPDILLADKHPLGVRGELRAALASLHAQGGRAVLGLRDVLDDPETVRREWGRHDLGGAIAEHYDRVLVFGSPLVLNPVRDCELPEEVSERVRFCGYVTRHEAPAEPADRSHATLPASERPTVLATAGGGEDGFFLLESFIAAARNAPWDGVVVTGPLCSDENRLALHLLGREAGVRVLRFADDLSAWFGAADALVSMGGYNTMVDAVSRGTPTVCVPRVRPRREQLIRAEAFSAMGLLRMVHPDELTPDRLRDEVGAALGTPRALLHRRAWSQLDFSGAERTADEILALAAFPAVAA